MASDQTLSAEIYLREHCEPEQTYRLQLRPQSGRGISALQENGVQQEMLVDGVEPGQGSSVKIRYRVSYAVGGQNKEEQGMVPALGIS